MSRTDFECALCSLIFLSAITAQFSSIRSSKESGCGNILSNCGTNCSGARKNCTGILSSKNFNNPEKIEVLNLSHNRFTGIDEIFWRDFTSLRILNLSSNNISEVLSKGSIGKLGKLEHLDLSWNNFSGNLTGAILPLSSLTNVSLRGNNFRWNAPVGEKFNYSLKHLDLSSNRFGPQEFPYIMDDSSLAHLNLSSANLSGEISRNLSKLVHLRYLDLSWNGLSDDLDDAIGSLPNLTFVVLKGNKLSWDTSNCLSSSLEHLDLSSNTFVQEFPCVNKCVKLRHLDLSNANITGEIPEEISTLVNLQYLNLSYNQLKGQIPNLTGMGELDVLDLSSNNLTGNITSRLHEKLIKMSKFDLSGNSDLQVCSSYFQNNQSSFLGLREINCSTNNARHTKSNGKRRLKIVFAVLVPILVLVLVLAFLGFAYRRRKFRWAGKQPHKKGEYGNLGPYSFQTESSSWGVDVKLPSSLPVTIIDKPLLNLTFADLLAATCNFNRETLSTEGRFGPVYHGVLPGELHVDIKVLVHNSVLTDQEAGAELEHLGRTKHSNLVPLIGYCLAGTQRIVVYEHMQNGDLDALLHDSPIGCDSDDAWGEDGGNGFGNLIFEGKNTWAFRHRVALGVARGLAFLHHGCSPQIVHGDVMTRSILLDSEFEPRLSDYGLAELLGNDFVDENPYGSPGYIPQVISGSVVHCGRNTEADVFAFGVVLFELVTGKKPFDSECKDVKDADMVSWIRGLVSRNQLSDAIDERIQGSGPEKHMEEALRIGYLCTANAPSKRPSMQQIVGLLKDIEPRTLN